MNTKRKKTDEGNNPSKRSKKWGKDVIVPPYLNDLPNHLIEQLQEQLILTNIVGVEGEHVAEEYKHIDNSMYIAIGKWLPLDKLICLCIWKYINETHHTPNDALQDVFLTNFKVDGGTNTPSMKTSKFKIGNYHFRNCNWTALQKQTARNTLNYHIHDGWGGKNTQRLTTLTMDMTNRQMIREFFLGLLHKNSGISGRDVCLIACDQLNISFDAVSKLPNIIPIDFYETVRVYLKQTIKQDRLSVPIHDHILSNLTFRKQRSINTTTPVAIISESVKYWKGCSTDDSILLCRYPITDELQTARYRVFDVLTQQPCDADTLARFAASQLVGYPVEHWMELVDDDFVYPLDVSNIPGINKTTNPTWIERTMFLAIQRLMRLSVQPRESNIEAQLEANYGEDHNCVYVADLCEKTYDEAQVFRNDDSERQLQHLFQENTHYWVTFLLPLWNAVKSLVMGQTLEVPMVLSEEVTVTLRWMNGRYISIFKSNRDDTQIKQLTPELEAEKATLSIDVIKNAEWCFRAMKYMTSPSPTKGSLEHIIEVYSCYPMFIVWDCSMPTFEGSHVYASDAYKQLFGEQTECYHALCKHMDISMIWTISMQLLKGQTPRIHRDVLDRNGNIETYIYEYYRCKNKRFYIMVIEKKEDHHLPMHLENRRQQLMHQDGGTIWKAVNWGWDVMKWAFKPSPYPSTLDAVVAKYNTNDSSIFIVLDLGKEESLYYSEAFKTLFQDVKFFANHIISLKNPMYVMWDVM